MRKYIQTELTFFIQQHREKPKGRLFSELLEDECPFLLSQGKGEDKKWQGRKKFVVEITPYYYEHGVCLEDHDGTSAHLYTILISKQTYLRPFNTNKDRIKEI